MSMAISAFLTSIVLAIILYNKQGGIIVSLIALLSFIISGILIQMKLWQIAIDYNNYGHSNSSWILIIAGYIFFTFIIFTSLYQYIKGFKNLNTSLNSALQEIQGSQEEMEAANEEYEAQNLELLRIHNDLEENEKRYHSIFEGSHDGIVILKDNIYIDCNHRATEILGRKKEKLIGLTPFDISPEIQDDGTVSIKTGQSILDNAYNGFASTFQWTQLKEDKSYVDLEITLNLVEYRNEQYLLGHIRDITERLNIEKALKKNETLYRTLYTSAPEAIVIMDKYSFIDCNEKALQLFKSTYEKFTKLTVFDISPPLQPDGRNSNEVAKIHINRALTGKPQVFEFLHITEEKTDVMMKINLRSYEINNKKYLMAIAHDISEQKKYEKQIEQSLIEKDILLREIHHRVKNNMAIISSLLNLKSNQINNDIVKNAIADSQNRIKSMALIHDHLYQSENISSINLKNYIQSLLEYLIDAYRIQPRDIELSIECDDIPLSLDILIPFGLILNELTTNSLKHAFKDRSNGKISISLKKHDTEKVKFIYSDNGVGFPEELDAKETNTLGIEIIHNLTRQLHGNLDLNNINGTTYTIVFNQKKI